VAVWNEGYVSEVTYTTGFYREFSPGWIALAAMLLGHRPPPSSGAFRWAELGCGQGLAPNALAAAHKQAEFWGFDFNPSHIENARRMAASAGLGNAHFVEASFAELAAGDGPALPSFDYIVLHGVWSWVSAENRAHMVEFIRRHLAPGGIAYVSYNALAGWASMVPVQRMMRLLAQVQPGPSGEAVGRAMANTLEIARSDAGFFSVNPAVLGRLEQAQALDNRYLAHEYFNTSWDPVTFDEVSTAMEDAKCGFIGSATLTDNIDGVSVPAGVAKLLTQVTDQRLREAIRDLGAARPFRRDLFRRGTEAPPQGEHLALLQSLVLTGLGRENERDLKISTGIGHVVPRPEIYDPLIQRMAHGPLSFDELRSTGPLAGQPLSEVLQVLAFLLTGGLALPSQPEAAAIEATAGATALNRQIGLANANGANINALVSPRLGTAVVVDVVETLLLLPLLDGHANPAVLTEHVLELLAKSGRSVLKDGAVTTDPDQTREVMGRTVARILSERIGLFRSLGILPG
jgi:SAM-dependent methyltransferase